MSEPADPASGDTAAARVGSWLALAGIVAWGVLRWRAELTPVAYADDSSVHQQMVRFATTRFQAGHLPMTSWFPYLGLGSPQFLHYQGLPAMLTGLVGLATGADNAFRLTLYLLLSLWPLSVYASARIFRMGRGAAVAGGGVRAASHERRGCRLRVQGLRLDRVRRMGPAVGVMDPPIGVGVHVAGNGVASRRAPRRRPRGAHHGAALRDRLSRPHPHRSSSRSSSRALWRARLVRAGDVAAGALLASAWVTVPLLVQGRWAATNEVLQHTPLVNGYGASRVMSWLVTGQLFDAHRFPVVTVLAAAGLVVSLRRWRFTGPTRRGAPWSALLGHEPRAVLRPHHLRRAHGAPPGEQGHLHAPLHDGGAAGRPVPGRRRGRGGAAPGRGRAPRRRPHLSAWATGAGRARRWWWPSPVAVGIAVLAPAWTQIDAYGATNTGWVDAQHAADTAQGGAGRSPGRLRPRPRRRARLRRHAVELGVRVPGGLRARLQVPGEQGRGRGRLHPAHGVAHDRSRVLLRRGRGRRLRPVRDPLPDPPCRPPTSCAGAAGHARRGIRAVGPARHGICARRRHRRGRSAPTRPTSGS